MKIEFDITLTSKDMYRFSMYHAYTGSQGIISIVISILSFAAAIATFGSVTTSYTILYVAFGILFLIYMPTNLYLRSKRQFIMAESLQKPLHYLVDDAGIHTSQGEMTADLPWEQIYKIVSTKRNILVYSNRINAYIIPKLQTANHYEALQQMAKEHLPKYRYKMK